MQVGKFPTQRALTRNEHSPGNLPGLWFWWGWVSHQITQEKRSLPGLRGCISPVKP